MDSRNSETQDEGFERAIAARLAGLRSMPVDTSALDRRIQREIPPVPPPRLLRVWRWSGSARVLAASIVVLAFFGAFFLNTSAGPVLASTAAMAQFHDDLVSGRVPVTRVDSMQAANSALAAQWAQSPTIPNMPHDHVMACCMRSVGNKKIACVLVKGDGGPVTMTVANASDMEFPNSPVMSRNGTEFHVQSAGGLNMVMTRRDRRWICLIAKMPVDRLMDMACSLEF